jgi:hypothetical protein
MAMTLDGSNGVTFNDASLQGAAASPFGLKNRIINGDMVIDQRNAGASVTPLTSGDWYGTDRWRYNLDQSSKFSSQQSSVAPSGFVNSILVTSLSSYSVASGESFTLGQFIEGLNTGDLAWGTANAKTVTLSFWVRSSLTGTFGGSVTNSAINRSYPFSYTISAANTWEQKSVTITGDTTGTWLTTNGIGLRVFFSLGTGSTKLGTAGSWAGSDFRGVTGQTNVVGTNGATFYITGVQLEVGSTATPFERRLYNQELANCQRYFYKVNADAAYGTNRFGSVFFPTTTIAAGIIQFPVTMRTFPTGSYSSLSDWTISAAPGTLSVSAMSINTLPFNGEIDFTVSGATAGQGGQIRANTNTASISFSAEL